MEILGRNRLVLAAVVVAASLALSGDVLFLIVQCNGGERFSGTTLEPSKQVLASQSSHSRSYLASANSSTELNEPPMSSLEFLNTACPDVLAELPSECIDALDEFFIDSVLPH
ncbi:MAG: hypothetical protein F4X44_09660 [Gammaproteobacteria bacterium]|nr:hypothetical protein [Gammaproteobacteria bacterium]MYD80863.1 hypothetical protein [Gammaproteobacteria bacterium]